MVLFIVTSEEVRAFNFAPSSTRLRFIAASCLQVCHSLMRFGPSLIGPDYKCWHGSVFRTHNGIFDLLEEEEEETC